MNGYYAAAAIAGAWLLGTIPVAYVAARVTTGVDLRHYGTGTVSGTGVGRVAGFAPMAVAGVIDIAKGALAVLPVAGAGALAAALAAGACLVGHNWSPWLGFAGGRGIAPALGATVVLAWPGTVVLGLGLAIGKLVRATAAGSFVAQAALVPVLAVTDGAAGAALGLGLVLPMWVKRVAGNAPPPGGLRVLAHRLVHDHDPGGPR